MVLGQTPEPGGLGDAQMPDTRAFRAPKLLILNIAEPAQKPRRGVRGFREISGPSDSRKFRIPEIPGIEKFPDRSFSDAHRPRVLRLSGLEVVLGQTPELKASGNAEMSHTRAVWL